ncbi:MAG: GNAT family N-acetyltransferase [Acetobacteraceae bacterium]|nr:GNAT family N-acetyltransferase [Acetobacteraceae bacterium]
MLELTDAPGAADEAVIEDGLAAFNEAAAGYRDSRPLAVLARDPATGQTIGGLSGRTSFGLLFVDLVFLPDTLRGQGVGSQALAMMEAEAIRRGCKAGFLLTITFQAPEFYARHGWEEFGRIACDPPGTARVFMRKTLQA